MTTPTTCPRCNGPAPEPHPWSECVSVLGRRITALESALAMPPGKPDWSGRELNPGWHRIPDHGPGVMYLCKSNPDHPEAQWYLETTANGVCPKCAPLAGVFVPPAPAESPGDGDGGFLRTECDYHRDCALAGRVSDHFNARDVYGVSPPAPAAPSAEAKTCEPWCGRDYQETLVPMRSDPDVVPGSEKAAPFIRVVPVGDTWLSYCSPACRDAGRPMRPVPAISKTETTVKPQPAATPVPVSHGAAAAAVERLSKPDVTNGTREHIVKTLRRYVAQQESVEAALREEIAGLRDEVRGHEDEETSLTNERDALRAELARLGKVIVDLEAKAPAGTGTNRELACANVDCNHLRGYIGHDSICDRVTGQLDAAEARGREAAVPEVAEWRALGDSERLRVLAFLAPGVQLTDTEYTIARRVLEAIAGPVKKEG
jgi:hypothetical protein